MVGKDEHLRTTDYRYEDNPPPDRIDDNRGNFNKINNAATNGSIYGSK